MQIVQFICDRLDLLSELEKCKTQNDVLKQSVREKSGGMDAQTMDRLQEVSPT
jgi:hypothetical protein